MILTFLISAYIFAPGLENIILINIKLEQVLLVTRVIDIPQHSLKITNILFFVNFEAFFLRLLAVDPVRQSTCILSKITQ